MDARRDRTGATSAQRREAIIVTATAHFARDGYHGASLRAIAADCGLQAGHLYYYFKTKDDLLFEILQAMQARFTALVARPEPGSAEEHLRRLLTDHVVILCENVTAAVVSYENMRFLNPEARTRFTDERDRYEKAVGRLIDEQRSSGAVSDTPTWLLCKVVLGIVNWAYEWYRPGGGATPADIAEVLADRAMAALGK